MTALILAWCHELSDAGKALFQSVSTLHRMIETTIETQNIRISQKYPNKTGHLSLSPSEKCRFSELCIIPSRDILVTPPVREGLIQLSEKISVGDKCATLEILIFS